MKKLFSLLILSLFFNLVLIAQKGRSQFGIKGGVNIANVKVDDGSDYDPRTGFHVGGLVHIHVDDHWAVQPELLYSTQGAESGNTELKLDYINIPILLQYMTSGFRLQTGPQLGFLVSAESKTGDVEVDIDDNIKSIDFSWSFGAGYLFASGIGIDARFNLGITDINDVSAVEIRNRVFQVGLFYQFKPAK